MGISSMGSFQVQSRGSLINFPVPLGVGTSALNRKNFHMHILGVGLAY